MFAVNSTINMAAMVRNKQDRIDKQPRYNRYTKPNNPSI